MTAIKHIPTSILLLALLAALAACAGAATAPSSTPTTSTEPPTLEATSPPPSGAAVEVVAEVVAKELKSPWALAIALDGRLFVTEREGIVRVIRDGEIQPSAYLDMEVAQEGEAGLLGLALDPDFESNGHLYVYYTYKNPRGALRNRVVRWEDAGERGRNPAVILDDIPGARIHNGGRIKFGPDGKLYVTTGDASSSALAQDLDSPAGKILRINGDGSIPHDNPYPNSPVYSYGHRNPQGLAWHPTTGELFATEHGPVGGDEVNRIVAGGNYGWPTAVGTGDDARFRDPALHSGIETWAPSGAAFYSAEVLPPHWKGRLVFGALRGQRIMWVDFRPPDYRQVQEQDALFPRQYGRIRDVVQGHDGYLYFITSNLDGRGNPRQEDDLLLRIAPVTGVLSHLIAPVDSP